MVLTSQATQRIRRFLCSTVSKSEFACDSFLVQYRLRKFLLSLWNLWITTKPNRDPQFQSVFSYLDNCVMSFSRKRYHVRDQNNQMIVPEIGTPPDSWSGACFRNRQLWLSWSRAQSNFQWCSTLKTTNVHTHTDTDTYTHVAQFLVYCILNLWGQCCISKTLCLSFFLAW